MVDHRQLGATLGQLDAPRSVRLLRELAGEADPVVRRTAEMTLRSMPMGTTLEDLRKALASGDRHARFEAVSSIASRFPGEALPELKKLLGDPDRWVRFKAARQLAYLGNPSGIPVLREEMKDRQLQRDVVGVLGLVASREEADGFLTLVKEKQPGRGPAAVALARLTGLENFPAWESMLTDPDEYTRSAAVMALGESGDPKAVPRILPFLRDEKSSVLMQAAEALGKLGGGEAEKALISLLQDKDPNRRMWALRVFGNVGGREATAAVLPLLDAEESHVREEALPALERLGAAQALPQAKVLLTDPSLGVRRRAAAWVCRSGCPEGVSSLLSMQHDLFGLNALRRPAAWEKLKAVRFKHPIRKGGALGVRAVASDAGLAVEFPDSSTDSPNVLWNARSAVEALSHSSVILEEGRLIVLSPRASLQFWRKWWQEEGSKRAGR